MLALKSCDDEICLRTAINFKISKVYGAVFQGLDIVRSKWYSDGVWKKRWSEYIVSGFLSQSEEAL